MMKIKINMGLLAAWTVVSVLAGFWYSRHAGIPASPQGRAILFYHDPMHPSYRSDKPGIAPDCGMQLEPVYAERPEAAELADATSALPAGAVRISAEKQQAIGVRVGPVEKTSGRETVRLLARVAADEDRIFRVVTAIDGFIRDTHPNSAGTMVKKGDVLVTLYAREFLSAQTAYFFALESIERFKQNGQGTPAQMSSLNLQLHTAEESLQILGMSDVQMKRIAQSREGSKNIEIRAPTDGLVLARNVYKGQRFERNTELYRIADINHVWIQADVFENDRRVVRPGSTARVQYQGRTLQARVSEVPPQFDTGERTLKLRLEADNPGQILRPGMFVDVDFAVDLPKGVTVPVEAVLDSGLHKTVFVERSSGSYEPRAVETGWHFGDRVEIVRGLAAGERIVVAGNFLIDSESRMQAAGQAPAMSAVTSGAVKVASGAIQDPSCGMELDAAKAAGKSEYHGKTYYFCSKSCKEKFDKDPKKYGDAKQVARL